MNKTTNKGQEHEGNDILQGDLAEFPEDNAPSKTSKTSVIELSKPHDFIIYISLRRV